MTPSKKTILGMMLLALLAGAAFGADAPSSPVFPVPLSDYPDAGSLPGNLDARIKAYPFNLFASIIFLCAIVHTFCHRIFIRLADKVKARNFIRLRPHQENICCRILHMLGEVEVVFAFWLIPLFAGYIFVFGWGEFTSYIHNMAYVGDKYAEPVFVVAIMAMASTKPVVHFASCFIRIFAKIGGGTIKAWWCAILCVGPLLGSFITEPAAITICAILLVNHFFRHNPGEKFKYATVALLFVSVSVGGTLTHFAAPPVLMVARTWGWDSAFMLANFGWKAALGVFVCVFASAYFFRKEFAALSAAAGDGQSAAATASKIPPWVVIAHLAFLAATVLVMHHVVLVFLLLFAFIAFMEVSQEYQYEVNIRGPLLVGIFLAALVTHGSFQSWWIEPVLMELNPIGLFLVSIFLTSFNDNAAITYLASLVPGFTADMKYFVVAGAVSGGGLTILANAPNLAGFSILKSFFGGDLSAKKLLTAAIFPTLVVSAIFYFPH